MNDPRTVFASPIRARNLSGIRAAIRQAAAKIQRRLPDVDFDVTVGEPYGDAWCLTHRELGGSCGDTGPGARPCHRITEQFIDVAVEATGLPMWQGWRVAGVLTADSVGTVTAANIAEWSETAEVPGTDRVATDNMHLAGTCAHCGTTRKRRTTVLLTNDAEVRPVGSTCLADYTGDALRSNVLPALTSLGERFAIACGVDMQPDPKVADVLDVVAMAAALVRIDGGYIAVSAATFRRPSTADRVRHAFAYAHAQHAETTGVMERPAVVIEDITAADRATAAAAIAAVLASDSATPFVVNLRAAAGADMVALTGKGSTVGPLSYLTTWAAREAETARRAAEAAEARQAAQEVQRVDAHIGQAGERRTFTGTVVSALDIDTDHGSATLLIVDTAEGTVKVFGRVPFEAKRGDTVTFVGTIQKHETYAGHRQTKVVRIAAAATAAA